jgi:hypothetical protein
MSGDRCGGWSSDERSHAARMCLLQLLCDLVILALGSLLLLLRRWFRESDATSDGLCARLQ